jgi:hypothetical protein
MTPDLRGGRTLDAGHESRGWGVLAGVGDGGQVVAHAFSGEVRVLGGDRFEDVGVNAGHALGDGPRCFGAKVLQLGGAQGGE